MVIIVYIPQGILDHRINEGVLSLLVRPHHTVAVTALGNCERSKGHGLHAAGNNYVSVACDDHLSRLVHAVQTGAADNVCRNGCGLNGKACLQGSLTGGVLAEACLDDAAHVYVLYVLRLDACALDCLFDDSCAEVNCRDGGKLAAHRADGCTTCAGDNYLFFCHSSCLLFPFLVRFRN